MDLVKREMITVPIDTIFEDDNNTRTHNSENLETIKSSFNLGNQTEPILVQKGTRKIIAGHGRLEVMKDLGFTEVNIIELDYDDDTLKALSILHNRSGELAGWNFTLLNTQLNELETCGFSKEQLGFTELKWDMDSTKDNVEDIPENLDGIEALIKIKCPQELKEDVINLLKAAIEDSGFKGLKFG